MELQWHAMEWLGKAWKPHGIACQSKERKDKKWHGMERKGMTLHDKEMHGMA
jgi:hypothetical protein